MEAQSLSREMLQMSVEAIHTICVALHVTPHDIKEIEVLKKGMTNRSFTFVCSGEKYIMRIPGEGTGEIINRAHEAAVYDALAGKGICDNIVFIDAKTGFKISRFIDNARVCDPQKARDTAMCMKRLRAFHQLHLNAAHEFDLFAQIDFYERLMKVSSYPDYNKVKSAVLSLRPFIKKHSTERTLCHIDSVPDNFLFVKGDGGTETIRMIDWEYAGMCDPHVDIAMFIVYAMYGEKQAKNIILSYFDGEPNAVTMAKIHCYAAVCGLLWSNWCEYKKSLGVEFGVYAAAQYNAAREYSNLAQQEISLLSSQSSALCLSE